MKQIFIDSINNKLVVKLTFDSKEKGTITRICIPFDFGPSRRYKDGLERYHFYDLDSPDGKHNLSLLPEQILEISLTEQSFDPSEYITWTPNWFVKRDWGSFS
ncbi:MAG: hypothetical protein IPP81_07345 [Chitinophagaceae bacterium]|nr:hypothetical protein [Chitinophagaceae bacterium]